MTTPKISIVLANYNNGIYLDDCLRSVAKQSFTDWECIVVDDGSTDDSKKIIRRWAKTDSRFKPLFQKNSGVSAARNRGIERATGEWVAFLDSDDCFAPDALKILYTLGEQTNAGIVGGGGMRVPDEFKLGDDTPTAYFVSPPFIMLHSNPVDIMKMFYLGEAYRFVWVWRRLFRRGLLEKIRFDEELYPGEDTCFMLEILPHARRIVETKSIVVYHRMARTAVSSAPFNQKSIAYIPPTLRRIRWIMDTYYPPKFQREFYKSFMEMIMFETVVKSMTRGRMMRQAAQVLRTVYGRPECPTKYLSPVKRLILWLFIRVF
ncbi:MAG: glycosyltransferase family 2 protein [Alphaproteobacteria bacterium]|nr:glycosyltransferase family 2 protein [Alphaproteobacteria bacterium]